MLEHCFSCDEKHILHLNAYLEKFIFYNGIINIFSIKGLTFIFDNYILEILVDLIMFMVTF
jgi:hypothetical protein